MQPQMQACIHGEANTTKALLSRPCNKRYARASGDIIGDNTAAACLPSPCLLSHPLVSLHSQLSIRKCTEDLAVHVHPHGVPQL